jgi:hypothetical protein
MILTIVTVPIHQVIGTEDDEVISCKRENAAYSKLCGLPEYKDAKVDDLAVSGSHTDSHVWFPHRPFFTMSGSSFPF